MIRLADIDESNWRTPLSVSEHQRPFVSDSAALLARAYAYRNSRSRAFLICDGDTAVGMALYYDCDPLAAYDLSQLFIDERFQRRGYGTAAATLIFNAMRAEGKYRKVVLCYIEGNHTARKFYERFGFVETDRDGDEIIMELTLS